MGERYSSWEADPLFSAAEIVQDSADRYFFSFNFSQNSPFVSFKSSLNW